MSWTFNPPPGWPVPSGNWVPPPDWTPDPDWPPAPPGWEFWVYVDPPAEPSHPPRPGRRWSWPEVALAVLAGIILVATGTGALVAYTSQDDQLPEDVRELHATDPDYAGSARVAVTRVGGSPAVFLTAPGTDPQVLDLATGEPLRTVDIVLVGPFATGEISGRPVAVTDSGRTTRQAGSGPRRPTHPIRVWDLTTGERLRELTDHTDSISSVAAGDLAGTPIAVSTSVYDHSLRIWDLATGEQLHELYSGGDDLLDGRALAVAEMGGRTLIAVSTTRSIRGGTNRYGLDVWSVTAGEEPEYERRLSCPYGSLGAPETAAVGTRDGTPVAVSGCDRAVMWDVTTGEKIAQLDADLGVPEEVALSEPHGTPVAIVGMFRGPLLAWDLDDPDHVRHPDTGHSGSVRSLAVAELDGENVVVSGGTHGRVYVWPLDLTGRAS